MNAIVYSVHTIIRTYLIFSNIDHMHEEDFLNRKLTFKGFLLQTLAFRIEIVCSTFYLAQPIKFLSHLVDF